MTAANAVTLPLTDYAARPMRFQVDGKIATITLERSDRNNPLTFESYVELADVFRAAAKDTIVKAIVLTGAGGNISSGGDVFEIIAPLVEMEWAMAVDAAIEAEAVAQALCMQTADFTRAYRAFAAKQKPVFEGN